MAKELTALAVEKIKPGPTRKEIPDGRVGGLYFIVQPSGKKSWAVRYRFGGKPCKLTIGTYPAIDLKTARERAGEAKDKVAEGKNPSAERKATRGAAAVHAADTVEAVAARFISQYVKRNLRPLTVREVTRTLDKKIIPRWGSRHLAEITRQDIHDLLDSIVEGGGPVAANRTLAWFRRMCSWAVERGLVDVNPCAGIRAPAAETARDRVLSDEELKAVWQAADALEQPYKELVRMLILSGQRRNEVAGMCWSEIDLPAKIWTLPAARAKNGREHTVPLSDQAVDILRGLPRIDNSNFVFTLTGRRPITALTRTKRQIDALMAPNTPPWVPHDIRRTVASGMARLGINLPVIEKLLNHTSGSFAGIVGVYQRHTFADEKRAAMAVWAQHVANITNAE